MTNSTQIIVITKNSDQGLRTEEISFVEAVWILLRSFSHSPCTHCPLWANEGRIIEWAAQRVAARRVSAAAIFG